MFISGFNRAHVRYCEIFLDLFDNYGQRKATTSIDCTAAAHNGGQWVYPTPWQWGQPAPGRTYHQIAKMWVVTYGGALYTNTQSASCPSRYWPANTSLVECWPLP